MAFGCRIVKILAFSVVSVGVSKCYVIMMYLDPQGYICGTRSAISNVGASYDSSNQATLQDLDAL